MSNYDSRKQPFDYSPPTRNGSASGALFLIGGIVVLFLLGIVFLGGGSGTLPEEGAAPTAVTPADGAPVEPAVDPAAPAVVD